MQLNKLSIAKFIVSGIVGVGTGKIVGKVISNHINPETLIDKVTVTAAAWVIGAMATGATKKYTNETIDEAMETFNYVKNTVKENLILNKVNRGEMTFNESGLDVAKFHINGDKWERITPNEDEKLITS